MKKELFRKKYIELRWAYLRCNIDKVRAVAAVRSEADSKINETRRELSEVREKYFITKLGNAKLFLDRVELGGNKISFDVPYSIEPIIEKRAVVVGHYKNGKPRTKTMPFAFVVIMSENGMKFNIQAGNTITEARALARDIETRIAEGKPLKKQLDEKCSKLEKQIDKLEKERADLIEKTNEEFKNKKQESKKKLADFLRKGTSEELGFLFRPSRIVLMGLLSLVGVCMISLAAMGYVRLVKTLAEQNSSYEIEAPDNVEFDCNMRFDESEHVFLCDSKNYSGQVKMTGESSLSIGGEWHVVDGAGNFERYIPELMISAADWAVEEPDFKQILEKYNYYYDMIVIYNNYLRSGMKQKDVVVTWRFSDDDYKLMNDVWKKWDVEQKQKAKERLEAKKKAEEKARKEAEEKAQKEAEEAARKQVEAETKAAEEARKKAASSSSSSSAGSGSSSSGSSSSSSGSSGGGYSSSEIDIDGYCKDGTKVHGNPHAKGKANVCYGHKGWVGN